MSKDHMPSGANVSLLKMPHIFWEEFGNYVTVYVLQANLPAFSQQWNWENLRSIQCAQLLLYAKFTVAVLGNFCPNSIWDKSHLKVLINTKSESKGSFVTSILKVIYLMPLFFHISNLLVPKIEICLKYYLDKNPQKQSLWAETDRKLLVHSSISRVCHSFCPKSIWDKSQS